MSLPKFYCNELTIWYPAIIAIVIAVNWMRIETLADSVNRGMDGGAVLSIEGKKVSADGQSFESRENNE